MERKDEVLLQRYELGRLLGQGTFARVHYARNLKTGGTVAVKVIHTDKILKAGMMEQMKREISIMSLVKHPNVVELYEVLATKKKIYLVMEYAKGGELFDQVAKGKLKENTARKYFQQLISAVDYCHSRGIFHRDLKLENLLLDESGRLKITDFGLSALAENKHLDGLLHTTCGTPAYVAPEVINKKGYDGAKADVWSCGVILYVMLVGYLPFRDSNLMIMYRKIIKGEYKLPSGLGESVCRIMARILDPNPSSRISTEQLSASPWFKEGLALRNIKTSSHEETSELGDDSAIRPSKLNAFEIISFSAGFDLSGLFEGHGLRNQVRFTSNNEATVIVKKLRDIAKVAEMRMEILDKGNIKMEGAKPGRKGVLCIDTEILEIGSEFHLVEMNRANGDTLEYHEVLGQKIRPALKDIVWTWQGEQQHKQNHQVQENNT
ncbi:unnamed protein product [Rhodiola kirilowii]